MTFVHFLKLIVDWWTDGPTDGPTDKPTDGPTDQPTEQPTEQQTEQQTNMCTYRAAIWAKNQKPLCTHMFDYVRSYP